MNSENRPHRTAPKTVPTAPVPNPFRVGCGFAARETWSEDGRERGVRVVRLKDGASARLLDGRGAPMAWQSPLAISCDEMFVRVTLRERGANIARVRLDSLTFQSPRESPLDR